MVSAIMSKSRRLAVHATVAVGALASQLSCAALTVTQPTASTVVPAGDDYATQVLGNAWDMNDAIDMDTQESISVSGQSFGSGVFTATSTSTDPNLYPLFMGYASSINLSRGALHPIDTSHYRYVTFKMRLSAASFAQVFFYQNNDSTSNGTFGFSNFFGLAANQWTIVTVDMLTAINSASAHHWTDFASVGGLRLDPATTTGVTLNIDWIRLTAPATSAQKTTVQWTDTGSGPYTISAIDAGGISYTLGTGVSGTSYVADTSFLAPGQYQIQVTRTGATASSASFTISTPPQISITAPSVRGDQSRDFATTVVGNAWGPFSAADFSTNGVAQNGVIDFKNVNYTTYPNSFYGRPTNNDPEWFFNLGGNTIDAGLYRSLCFDLEVFGVRDLSLAGGSVARVFWGSTASALTTSQDIVLDDNQGDTVVSEYCIPDLSVVPLEANPNGGAWSGTKGAFRIDPDEFTPPNGCSTKDACHDVRLDSVRLSPWYSADTGFTFTWTLATTRTNTIDIYLDPDATPGNGNEILVGSTTAGNGAGQYVWPGGSVSGTYNVLFVVDDGFNTVFQYAGGPLVVTADIIFRNGFEP